MAIWALVDVLAREVAAVGCESAVISCSHVGSDDVPS